MTTTVPRILVVDDEVPLLRALQIGLRAKGYEIVTATTAEDGVSATAVHDPDVVVLDLGLPDADGIEVCRRIRSWSDVPIIVLSAHGADSRKVEALDEGADDFVTKPFSMAELQARIRVALRHGSPRATAPDDPTLVVGDLRIDRAQRVVERGGRRVELTPREFDLLAFLAAHAGRVLTHRMVLEQVWGPGYGSEIHYLRVYANRLRQKLGDPQGTMLRTFPGVGYQLVGEEPAGPTS
ncbi:MAG: response regulator transcription factor [Actinomycetes bacterium]